MDPWKRSVLSLKTADWYLKMSFRASREMFTFDFTNPLYIIRGLLQFLSGGGLQHVDLLDHVLFQQILNSDLKIRFRQVQGLQEIPDLRL